MPRKPKYRTVQIFDGAWYELANFDRDICCSCSLVHKTEYKFEDGKIWFRTKVDQRETAKLRKAENIKVTRGVKTAE